MKRSILMLASVCVALGAFELVIRALDLFARAREAITLAHEIRPASGPTISHQLHPFWGWMVRPNAPSQGIYDDATPRNRFGFKSNIGDYRDVAPSDFAIGIFGGSVAMGLALWGGDEIAGVLARERPELAGKIRILNFGSGSFKQPQQLFVLAEMILLGIPLDYVVTLDGLNESALGAIDAAAGNHPLFPARSRMQFLAYTGGGAPTDAFFEKSAEILRERRAAEWMESLGTGWLAHSYLVKSLAGALAIRHHRRAVEIDAELQGTLADGADSDLIASISDDCLGREQGCWELIADIWARSSVLMAAQSAAIGAGYLHALQPSQYVPDSKRFTAQELERAYVAGTNWQASVRAAYPLLRERATHLSARGIEFLDLTPSFVDVDESIYIDAVGHMNEVGNAIVGKQIGKRIAARLASASAAAEPPLRSQGSRPTHGR